MGNTATEWMWLRAINWTWMVEPNKNAVNADAFRFVWRVPRLFIPGVVRPWCLIRGWKMSGYLCGYTSNLRIQLFFIFGFVFLSLFFFFYCDQDEAPVAMLSQFWFNHCTDVCRIESIGLLTRWNLEMGESRVEPTDTGILNGRHLDLERNFYSYDILFLSTTHSTIRSGSSTLPMYAYPHHTVSYNMFFFLSFFLLFSTAIIHGLASQGFHVPFSIPILSIPIMLITEKKMIQKKGKKKRELYVLSECFVIL